MLQQLHTAVADIEQLKADLLTAAHPAQPTQPAEHALPAVDPVSAVNGKKRLRNNAGAAANAQPRGHRQSTYSRLGRANRLTLNPPTTDAATQSEVEALDALSAQPSKAAIMTEKSMHTQQPHGSGLINRRRMGGHYSEQPCLRAQRELIVPGQHAIFIYCSFAQRLLAYIPAVH